MNDLKALVAENLDIEVAKSTLSHHGMSNYGINRLGYSYNLMRPVSEQHNSNEVKQQRMEYVE